MEYNYDQLAQVINFWTGCFFFVVYLIVFIVSLFDSNMEVEDYVATIAVWLIGSLICFKVATFLWFIVFLSVPFIIIWQIRRNIIKIRNKD